MKGETDFFVFFQQEVPPTKMTSTDENDHPGQKKTQTDDRNDALISKKCPNP